MSVLLKNKNLEAIQEHKHTMSSMIKEDPLHGLDRKEMSESIKKKVMKFKYAMGEGDHSDSDASDGNNGHETESFFCTGS